MFNDSCGACYGLCVPAGIGGDDNLAFTPESMMLSSTARAKRFPIHLSVQGYHSGIGSYRFGSAQLLDV